MPKCPDCGKCVSNVKKHQEDYPITCTIDGLTLTPEERREQILREVKREGIKVAKPYIDGKNHGDPLYHAMADASSALGNGEGLHATALALQAIGAALIKGNQGVTNLEKLQKAANRIGYELNLSPRTTSGHRRPRKFLYFR